MGELFWTAMAIAFASLFWAIVWLYKTTKRHRGKLHAENSLRIQVLRDRCDRYGKRLTDAVEQLTAVQQSLQQAIEENTRLTGELAIAKLSLENYQNRHAEMVELFGQVKKKRDEYKDMLKGIAHMFTYERDLLDEVLREYQDFEAQGESKRDESEAEE